MNHNQTEAYLRRLTLPRRHLGWAALALLLGWAVVSLVLSERGLLDLWELEGKESVLRAELQELRVEAAEVDWELDESQGMGIERPAREKFEMQRPGEIVYHFTAVADDSPGSDEKETHPAADKNVPSESLTSTK